MSEWPLSALVALSGFIGALLLLVLSWLVGFVSEKWSNRIAVFALLLMLQGGLTAVLMQGQGR